MREFGRLLLKSCYKNDNEIKKKILICLKPLLCHKLWASIQRRVGPLRALAPPSPHPGVGPWLSLTLYNALSLLVSASSSGWRVENAQPRCIYIAYQYQLIFYTSGVRLERKRWISSGNAVFYSKRKFSLKIVEEGFQTEIIKKRWLLLPILEEFDFKVNQSGNIISKF